MFQTKVADRTTKKNFLCSITLSEYRAVYEAMLRNVVDADRPQMAKLYGACALRAGYLRLQTHTQNT